MNILALSAQDMACYIHERASYSYVFGFPNNGNEIEENYSWRKHPVGTKLSFVFSGDICSKTLNITVKSSGTDSDSESCTVNNTERKGSEHYSVDATFYPIPKLNSDVPNSKCISEENKKEFTFSVDPNSSLLSNSKVTTIYLQIASNTNFTDARVVPLPSGTATLSYFDMAGSNKSIWYGKTLYCRPRFLMANGNYLNGSIDFQPIFYPDLTFSGEVDYDLPKCQNGSPTIKIPVSTTENYVITIKGSWEGAQGYNYLTSDLQDPVSGYYIIDESSPCLNSTEPYFLLGYKYTLNIEQQSYGGTAPTPCAFSKEFDIPNIPDFNITHTGYGFNGIDNTDRTVHISKIGDNGRINLRVVNSCTQSITIRAGTFSRVDNLLESSVSDRRTYYSGNTYIEVPAGTYSVSVENAYCTSNVIDNIELEEPTPITFELSSTNISCHTSSFLGSTDNGTITVSDIEGGIGSYSAPYNLGSYTINGISFSEDEHSVTVTDQYGNSTTNTISVEQNNPLTVQVNSISSPSLSCLSNGVVTLINPAGGIAPYEFSADGVNYQSSAILNSYGFGNQYAYIRDDSACVSRVAFNVPSVPELIINSQNIVPPSCYEYNNGQYSCVVENAKGELTVNNLDSRINPSNVVIAGNQISINGLSAGNNYYFEVADNLNGGQCFKQQTFSMPSKPQIGITSSVSHVKGKGTPTGSVSLIASGGNSGSYTFSIYNENNLTQPIETKVTTSGSVTFGNLYGSALDGGKLYYIDVKDNSECSYFEDNSDSYHPIRILEPQVELMLEFEIQSPITCFGDNNAVVELSASGGWSQQYLFSRDGINWGNSSVFSNFSAGTYTLYVRDYNGGEASVIIPISQPYQVAADIIPIDVTCYDDANGSISISNPRGGNGGYTYMVNNNGVWKGADVVTPNLIPGKYTVRVKDGSGCYSESPVEVTITQPAPLELERQVVVQPKCELNNGSILAEIQGGNGLYRYEWLRNDQSYYQDPIFSDPEFFVADTIYSLGDTLPSFDSYYLNVVDKKGCTLNTPIKLNVYDNPILTLTPEDVRCFGETNGVVNFSGYYGKGAFDHVTINSSNMATPITMANSTGSFQNLSPGVYAVSVYDKNGCVTEYGATIEQPVAPLTAVASVIQPVLTMGTSTGIIRSAISGGNDGLKTVTLKNSLGEPVVSSQQPGSFPFNMNSLYAGNYKVTVLDRKGCEFISDPIQVLEPTSVLGFTVVEKKDALCKSQTGSFTVQATGGWGDYKYKRSTQNSFYNSGKFENLYAGNYVVTVKDRFEATYTDTVVLYEPKDSLRAWVAELNNPTCVGNGSVVLGLDGGTAAYKIFNLTRNDSLSVPGVQPVSITGLSAGDNQFRVVDGNGCRFNLETSLNNSQLLQVTFDTPTYPSTSASSDGALRAVVTGGKSPYSYQWSSLFGTPVAGNSATLSNIPSGHYEVNVAEANGCSIAKDIYLPNINDLPLKICYKHDESAYGASNGYCTLTASEKNWDSLYIITPAKLKFAFKPTDSTSMFDFRTDSIFLTNLVGGNYFVAGMADGTKYYAEFTIKPYELFGFGKVDVVNASKIGASNGKITVDVIGGGGGNQFHWEKIVGAGTEPQVSQDNEDNSVLSDISAGNYRVTVKDYFGNSISKDVGVDEPSSALIISVTESTNESCKDYTDAFVRLSAGGGWGDYQFRSRKSEYFGNSSLFSDLEVGTHRFYITDRMGAVDSVEVNITEPGYLTSRIASIDSVSCNGAADGRVEFAVDGGTAPYRFAGIDQSNLWIDGSAKGQLPAGRYRYIFTDNNNCIGQDTVEVEIPQPDSLLFNSIAVVHTTCEQDNGSIKVDLKGGTLPYRYEWLDSGNKPVGSQNSVGNLMRGGNYTLKVFDKNNCYQELKQRIETSTNPTVTNITTTDVVCYGESNGTATVQNYQYGSPIAPLTFTWSNGNTGLSASGYAKGTHYVTVTDTNNCSTVKYFDVVQPDSLRIAIVNSKMPKCFGYSDALIEATGVGGVGGYRYLWSTGADTSVLSNVSKGDYGLLVTDANNCEVYGIYSVGEPEELEVDLGDDILMCPGNTRVIDGQEFATHKWSTSQGEVSTERYFTVSQADSYFLEVTDNIGCLAHDTVAVAIGNNALVADFLVSSQVELTDTLMLFELSNMPLDSMRWDYSNSAFLKVDGDIVLDYIIYLKTLSKGIYNIDLYAYSGGCVSVATKQVEIVEDLGGNPDDDGLGYNDPLIKEFTVNPNPNTGDFTATVKLREVADINLVLFSVASGLKVNERFEYQLQDYSVPYNLVNLNSGVYLLIVKAGNERRQVKIVIQ